MKKITGITISPKKAFCIIKVWTTDLMYQNPNEITSQKYWVEKVAISSCGIQAFSFRGASALPSVCTPMRCRDANSVPSIVPGHTQKTA